jgi:hypothetical protein
MSGVTIPLNLVPSIMAVFASCSMFISSRILASALSTMTSPCRLRCAFVAAVVDTLFSLRPCRTHVFTVKQGRKNTQIYTAYKQHFCVNNYPLDAHVWHNMQNDSSLCLSTRLTDTRKLLKLVKDARDGSLGPFENSGLPDNWSFAYWAMRTRGIAHLSALEHFLASNDNEQLVRYILQLAATYDAEQGPPRGMLGARKG